MGSSELAGRFSRGPTEQDLSHSTAVSDRISAASPRVPSSARYSCRRGARRGVEPPPHLHLSATLEWTRTGHLFCGLLVTPYPTSERLCLASWPRSKFKKK